MWKNNSTSLQTEILHRPLFFFHSVDFNIQPEYLKAFLGRSRMQIIIITLEKMVTLLTEEKLLLARLLFLLVLFWFCFVFAMAWTVMCMNFPILTHLIYLISEDFLPSEFPGDVYRKAGFCYFILFVYKNVNSFLEAMKEGWT